MKKLMIVALAASSLTSVVLPAPALAAVATPIADMEAVCAATQIQPDPNARYDVALDTNGITSVTGAERELSRVTTLNIPGGQLLSQTGPTFVDGTEGRNGQSPNIFGTFKKVSTYSGGRLVQDVTYAQDTTFTFGCKVFKVNVRNGNITQPPGLQVTGKTMVRTETRTVTEEVSAPDYTREELSEAVICNSPTKNPGVWRAQNGYTGTCSTAKFLSLGQATIHSNSLPPLEYLAAPADHQGASGDYADGPSSVVDEDWITEDAI